MVVKTKADTIDIFGMDSKNAMRMRIIGVKRDVPCVCNCAALMDMHMMHFNKLFSCIILYLYYNNVR